MASWQAALIGCGNIGTQHTECLQKIDDVEMAAFCDIDQSRADALRKRFGGRYATADVNQLFEDDSIQIIYICTQHDTHADYAIRAAEHGKHILVEKPLALTVEQCIAISRAVESSGVQLMTAFKMRYYTLIQKVKELIPNPLVVTMQMMDNRWPDEMWANDPVKGGGNVLSQGVHSCDIIRHVAGSDPLTVSAVGANYYQKSDVIDNMAAVFQFANGVTGNLVQGDSARPSLVSKFYLQVFAENQAATLSDRLCTLHYQETGKDPQLFHGTETGFLEENRELIEALSQGKPAPVNHRDGLLATLMILQGFQSIASGQTQPVATLLD